MMVTQHVDVARPVLRGYVHLAGAILAPAAVMLPVVPGSVWPLSTTLRTAQWAASAGSVMARLGPLMATLVATVGATVEVYSVVVGSAGAAADSAGATAGSGSLSSTTTDAMSGHLFSLVDC